MNTDELKKLAEAATPGPWEWVGSNTLYGGSRGLDEVLAAADDGKPYGMHSALIKHHWDSDQAKANARLIEAANPSAILKLLATNAELVERLKDMIEASDSMAATYGRLFGKTHEDDDTYIHEKWAEEFLSERTEEARAALAKAERGEL